MISGAFSLVILALLAAWVTEPPRAEGVGAVPTPTVVAPVNVEAEAALCGYVRAATVEGVDLAYVAAAARDPGVRYSIAIMAATYAVDGSAGARAQLLQSCGRGGYG